MGKMFVWMITNVNKTIAIITAMITVIAVPLWLSGFGFILQTKMANADVKMHSNRLTALETVVYRIDGRLEEIVKANERIELSSQEAIKQAKMLTKEVRQLRQTNNQ